jgi:O-antigen/teichoic acid export membrane protein
MAAGGLVLVMLRLSLRAIGLVSIVILFRVLNPDDFGIVALAMLVVGFVEVFAEFGFDQALLRNTSATRHDYDVTWTLNFLRGVVVAALLAASAPLAARFLDEPRLTQVVLVLALAPLLDGLQNIGTVDFSKNLEFQKEFKLKVTQKLVSFVVTLVGAFVLRNYWALVLGVLSGRVAGVFLGYLLHPYRPTLSLQGWRSVMRFSLWILVNNIVLYAGNQTDKVVVQRSFNVHTVGILRVAEEISGMVMELVWPIEKSLYAGYVKVVQQVERFRSTLMTSIGLVAAIGVPLSLGLGALAEPAVNLVLGEKGRAAVPFIQVYVLYGAVRSCLCGVYPVFMVLGRPEVNTQVTFAAVAARLTVLLVAFPMVGLMAVPWSMVAGSGITFGLLWWRVTVAMKLSPLALPGAVWRSAAAAVLMALAGRWGLTQLGGRWGDVPTLALLIPACTFVYLGALALLWWASGRPAGAEQSALDAARAWWSARSRRIVEG